MKYLIAGLGNIGPKYVNTRHNIGFMAVDLWANQMGVGFEERKNANVAHFKFKAREVYLIKPTTFMNLSGKAVSYWMQQVKVPLSNVLIATDDIALPFNKVRFKGKGSHGGHNGLRNIEETLGTSKYSRCRIGVGNEFSQGRQVEYVLGEFDQAESKALEEELLPQIVKGMESFCFQGLDRTMNQFN